MNINNSQAFSSEKVAVFAMLALAAVLRSLDFLYLLPEFLHADEQRVVYSAMHMLREGTLDPDFLRYPGLFIYLNAFGIWAITTIHAMSVGIPWTTYIDSISLDDPSLYLVGRAWSFLAGMVSLVLCYILAKSIAGRLAGLIALFLLTVSSLHIVNSYVGKPDMLMVACLLATSLACLRLLDADRDGASNRKILLGYVWMGVAAGLVLASKYHIFVAFGLVLTHLVILRRHQSYLKLAQWLPAFACIAAGIISVAIFSPYSFFQPAEVLATWQLTGLEGAVLSVYHTSDEVWYHDAPFYHLGPVFITAVGLAIFIVSTYGILRLLARGKAREIIPFSFAYGHIVFASFFTSVHIPYHYLDLSVFVPIAAGTALASFIESRQKLSKYFGVALLITTCVYQTMYWKSHQALLFKGYEAAAEWMVNEIDPNASVLMFGIHTPTKEFSFHENIDLRFPQDLSVELLQKTKPDYIFVSHYVFHGFEKVYRHGQVDEIFHALMKGELGYEVVATYPARYFHDEFYRAIDLENEFGVSVLKRKLK